MSYNVEDNARRTVDYDDGDGNSGYRSRDYNTKGNYFNVLCSCDSNCITVQVLDLFTVCLHFQLS